MELYSAFELFNEIFEDISQTEEKKNTAFIKSCIEWENQHRMHSPYSTYAAYLQAKRLNKQKHLQSKQQK